MPYIDTTKVARMRKAIRAALPDFTVSVRKYHHSTVHVTLLSGPIVNVDNVNVFWYKDHLKDRPDAVAVIDTVLAEIRKVEPPHVVSEDGDYGSIPNYYYDVTFGAWDKPYVCTDPDAKSVLEIKRAFNEIKAHAEWKAWEAKRTCGAATLAPDDLVIPCILPVGHTGFCDTGR